MRGLIPLDYDTPSHRSYTNSYLLAYVGLRYALSLMGSRQYGYPLKRMFYNSSITNCHNYCLKAAKAKKVEDLSIIYRCVYQNFLVYMYNN